MFTWKAIHKETAQHLLKFRDRQDELLSLAGRMDEAGLKVISLNDRDANGNTVPLTEIDPFTFLAIFNRGMSDVNRRKNWEFLKKEWGLKSPVPVDFSGIPVAQNMKSWLFPYLELRETGHIPKLWDLFSEAMSGAGIGGVSPTVFDDCLGLRGVGLTNLTAGLFWILPDQFVCTDRKNVESARALGIEPPAERSYTEYRQWMDSVRGAASDDFAEFSHDAHERVVGITLSESQMELLWRRFHSRISDFEDFQHPGQAFREDELDPKRRLLERFQREIGRERLETAIASGQSKSMLDELYKLISSESNLVDYRAWGNDLPEEEDGAAAVLQAFLTATENPWSGPLVIDDLIAGIKAGGGMPSWSIMSALLWLLAPDSYFPVRSSHFRELAKELGIDFPFKRPTGLLFETLVRFGRAFWSALEPWSPSDWVDVQSFMWVVCPGTYGGVEKLGAPFDRLFVNRGDAEKLFEIYGRVLHALKIVEQQDHPALTLSNPNSYKDHINLSVGRMLLAGYNCREPSRLNLTMSLGRPAIGDERANKEVFFDEPGGEAYKMFPISFADALEDDSEAWQRFVKGARQLGEFHQTRTSPYRHAHHPELVAMCLDEEVRNQYLRDGLPEPDNRAVVREVDEEYDTDSGDELAPEPSETWPIFNREEELAKLFLDDTEFAHIEQLLKRKKNIVLAGAPGTGKTFLAARIAYAILEHKDRKRVRTVQFHQSFSYEDFVMGYRPDGAGGFVLRNGLFHEFCREAAADPNKDYFLVIDEINRGNLSKIFGELMMLIENDKRKADYAIRLAYAAPEDPPFHVPQNVHLIGSMNTADRSLALVDYALRRRFAFVEMKPGFGHANFRDYLTQVGELPPKWIDLIIQRMTALNEEIADDTYNLGPGYCIGHSFFTPGERVENPEAWYQDIVDYEVFPLLQEYWIDASDKAKEQHQILRNDLPE